MYNLQWNFKNPTYHKKLTIEKCKKVWQYFLYLHFHILAQFPIQIVFFLVGLLVLLAVVAFAATVHGRHYEPQDIYAEPNCAVVTDHSRMFRDISDPTHYWICPEGHAKAIYIQCPPNEAFMEKLQKCVVWEEWKWVEPYTK